MVEAKETKILCGDAGWQLVRQTVAQVARQEVSRYKASNSLVFGRRRKTPADFVVDVINEAIDELVLGGQIGAFGGEVDEAIRSQSGNLSDGAFSDMRDETWRVKAGVKALLRGLDIMIDRGILDNAVTDSDKRKIAALGGGDIPFWR